MDNSIQSKGAHQLNWMSGEEVNGVDYDPKSIIPIRQQILFNHGLHDNVHAAYGSDKTSFLQHFAVRKLYPFHE